MSIKNLLMAGDYFMLVPSGLHLTLQYDEKGRLEKIYEGFERKKDISDRLMSVWRSSEKCPVKIELSGGTTWITGVLYTGKQFYSSGKLPDCISEDLISEFISEPNHFNFFAGNVESMATLFKGARPIKQWLSMNNFNVLAGYLAPATITDSTIEQIVTSNFNFIYPLVSDYIVYRSSEVLYLSANATQHVVSKVTKEIDENGYIFGKINFVDEPKYFLKVDWSEIVEYNVINKCRLVIDSEGKIIYSSFPETLQEKSRETTLSCSYCGSIINVEKGSLTICPDSHCVSRLYNDLNHFCSVLKLPIISYERFREYAKHSTLRGLSSIFDLAEYEHSEITCTISSLLRAVVPVSHVPLDTFFISFANKCSNNLKTFLYYLQHPEKMEDLELNSLWSSRFRTWAEDDYNISTISDLLNNTHIHVVETNKMFEGAPIFRNVKIFVTGLFRHGTLDDIVSIFASYGAKTTTVYDSNVSVVVYGDLLEDIDGVAIKAARKANKSIFSESMFFSKYEIDSDLSANLV